MENTGANTIIITTTSGRIIVNNSKKAPVASRNSSGNAGAIQVSAGSIFAQGYADSLTGIRQFALDPVGRVTAVHGAAGTEQYSYDHAGNITDASWPATAGDAAGATDGDPRGERAYTGTLLRRAGNIRYQHDQRGRIVLRQHKPPTGRPRTWRYTWNSTDQLVEARTPDGHRWRYHYAPLGRRTAKLRVDDDGQTLERVDFVWDGSTLAEQVHTDWFPGVDSPIAEHTTTWNHHPHSQQPLTQHDRHGGLQTAPQAAIDELFHAIVADLVGTPVHLVAADGRLVWTARTTLWGHGQPQAPATEVDCPLRFPGQYADDETGLHYNGFRYYDPATARYTSPDPLGLAASPNPHWYVPNPTTWADPQGLAACRTFFSVQNAEDVARLLEKGGEPWPSGFTNGSLRDIFGPGLYAWETRAQAEAYRALRAARGADGLSILEHSISPTDLAKLRSVDLSAMSDDAANAILDLGAGHGYQYIRRLTGNFGAENYFASDVYRFFRSKVVG